MEMNDIIKDYVENRLYEMEDETGLSLILCCQSDYGTFHASLSSDINNYGNWEYREIESLVRMYFTFETYHHGDIYFNLLAEDLDKLQRKLKIQMILEE
jgi:hypothetical protein